MKRRAAVAWSSALVCLLYCAAAFAAAIPLKPCEPLLLGTIDYTVLGDTLEVRAIHLKPDAREPDAIGSSVALLLAQAVNRIEADGTAVWGISTSFTAEEFDVFFHHYQNVAAALKDRVPVSPKREYVRVPKSPADNVYVQRYLEQLSRSFEPTPAELEAVKQMPLFIAASELGYSKISALLVDWRDERVKLVLEREVVSERD